MNSPNTRGVAAVLGTGPGLGLAVARRFGRGGHPVAVVSRSDARHADYLAALESDGATAIAEVADVKDREVTRVTLARIEERLGPIEVLYHGPAGLDPGDFPVPIDRMTSDDVRRGFELVTSAVDAVTAVLPGMLERGRGTILLPTGLSAVRPLPMLGNLALASSALHSYAVTLNAAVADQGVYVASIVIGGGIRGGDIHRVMTASNGSIPSLDPAELAESIWAMVQERSEPEATYSVM